MYKRFKFFIILFFIITLLSLTIGIYLFAMRINKTWGIIYLIPFFFSIIMQYEEKYSKEDGNIKEKISIKTNK